MQTPVLWPYLAETTNARFWVVCYTDGTKTSAVVDPYDQIIQESYVEAPEQHEGCLRLFTTSGGAHRRLRAMIKDGGYRPEELKVCRIKVQDFAATVGQICRAYAMVRQRSLRVDVYNLEKDGSYSRELLYSRWIQKH